LITFS